MPKRHEINLDRYFRKGSGARKVAELDGGHSYVRVIRELLTSERLAAEQEECAVPPVP